jgi:hypothetical protein
VAASIRDVEQLCLEILNCGDGTQSTSRAFAARYRKLCKRGLKPLESAADLIFTEEPGEDQQFLPS